MTADLSLALAFAAGVVSFVSPCVLALLPVYVAYLGETTAALATAGVDGSAAATAAATAPRPADLLARGSVLAQALLFVTAFGAVFTVLGISVGLIGAPLFAIPAARQVAGVIVIVLGVLMTGVLGPVLDRFQTGIRLDRLPAGRSARSITLGALFALGWSPCIGPVLGAILTLGASSQSVAVATVLLLAYSAGLAVPFLLAAVALPRLRPVVDALRRWHRPVQVAAGLFVAATGVLIFMNAFARMAGLFTFVL